MVFRMLDIMFNHYTHLDTMYKITALLLLALLTFSCNSNPMNGNSQNNLPEELAGEWTLEGIEAANPVMEDVNFDDMDYRETYSFRKDGTFTKSRQDGMEADGTVSVQEASDGTYYVLSYGEDAPMDLLSACQDGQETLKIEDGKLINDARMCDRPRYTYSRDENEK